MSEEYVWKGATGKLSIRDTKPNHNITFHNGGKQIGALDFNGPEMMFSGDADESAKVFFDWIAKSFKARLEQERADEREACANLVFYSPPSNEYESPLMAVYNAIRNRSNT